MNFTLYYAHLSDAIVSADAAAKIRESIPGHGLDFILLSQPWGVYVAVEGGVKAEIIRLIYDCIPGLDTTVHTSQHTIY